MFLGGQDGWTGSSNMIDQVELWEEGAYVRMPLTQDAVVEAFPRALRLLPATAPGAPGD